MSRAANDPSVFTITVKTSTMDNFLLYTFFNTLPLQECGEAAGESKRKLRISDQSVLSHEDCRVMRMLFYITDYSVNIFPKMCSLVYVSVKGIKSPKELTSKQLCAGHKLVTKRPRFYEYSGKLQDGVYNVTEIEEIEPLKEYKDRFHDKVCRNFMWRLELETNLCKV